MKAIDDIFGIETEGNQVHSSRNNPVDVGSEINDGTSGEDTKEEKASSIYSQTQVKDFDIIDDDSPAHDRY